MCAVCRDHSTHAHHRRPLEQTLCDDGVGFCQTVQRAGDGQDPVRNALDHLAHSCLDASLVAKIGHVLPGLADDDASLFGRDDGTQSQLGLGVLLLGPGSRLAVRSQAIISLAAGIAHGQTTERLGEERGVFCLDCSRIAHVFGSHLVLVPDARVTVNVVRAL